MFEPRLLRVRAQVGSLCDAVSAAFSNDLRRSARESSVSRPYC